MALRKRDAAVASQDGSVLIKAKGLLAKYPALWEWMTLPVYEDGSRRTLPTVNVFIDAGMVKAFANDRDQGLSACLTSDTLEGLLAALDDGLKADTLEWRVSGAPKKRR
jgi:hypothetical protein